jgi:nucleoside diphosphate kinase
MFDVMLSGPQPISTLLAVKPRAVKKHLTKILRKVLLEGFKVVGLRQAVVREEEELLCLIDEDGQLVSR